MASSSLGFAESRKRRIAHVLLFVTPALFTANMLLARATADFSPPVALAELRWTGVVLVLLPFCGRELWRARAALRRDWARYALLGLLGMGICGAGVYHGAATTTATNIGLIYAVSPVIIILLSRAMFGERLSRRQGLGAALALAGVLASMDATTLRTEDDPLAAAAVAAQVLRTIAESYAEADDLLQGSAELAAAIPM